MPTRPKEDRRAVRNSDEGHTVGVRVSARELTALDTARGDTPLSTWVREAALDVAANDALEPGAIGGSRPRGPRRW